MSVVETKHANSLNFSQKAYSGSVYERRVIVPDNEIAVTAQAPSDAVFSIPAEVINFGGCKSRLRFAVTWAATADRRSFARVDALAPIRDIILRTAGGGKVLYQCEDVAHFTKMTLMPTTEMNRFLSYTNHGGAAALANGNRWGQCFGPVDPLPHRDFAAAATAAGAITVTAAGVGGTMEATNAAPTNVQLQAGLRAILAATLAPALNTVVDTNATQAGNIITAVGTTADVRATVPTGPRVQRRVYGGVNGILAVNYDIPLSIIPHSIFQVDRDLYFGETLELVVRFAPTNNWGYEANTGADTPWIINANVANITGAPTFSNADLQLHLSVMSDSMKKQAIKSAWATEGLRLVVPQCHRFVRALGAAGQKSFRQTLTLNHGNKLRHVYFTVFSPAETDSRYLQNCNDNGADDLFWSAVRTFKNTTPLQDRAQNFNDSTAYSWLMPKFKDSVMSNYVDYRRSCLFLDDFCGLEKLCDSEDLVDYDMGEPLLTNIDYQADFTTLAAAANSRGFMFAITQKILSTSPMGTDVYSVLPMDSGVPGA